MHLGTLIHRLQREEDAGLALEALDDIVLFTEVATMAAKLDETPSGYVASAAARFANLAGDEDWVGILGAAERTPEPARAILGRMLRWSLDRDAREIAQASATTQAERP